MYEPKIERIEEVVIAVKEPDEAAAYFKELFGMDFFLAGRFPMKGSK
jgi:hypothetical protein